MKVSEPWRFAGRVIALALLAGAFPAALAAQDDNSGTNPIAFTWDFRFYPEAQSRSGDNSFQTFTFEHRVPLSSNWQFRTKSSFASSTVDAPGGNVTTSGFGDTSVRLLHIPMAGPKFALALGLEAFLNTASQPNLGEGRTSLGPQLFAVFFGALGEGTLIAPAYQYQFDIAGDDGRAKVSRSLVDLFIVWIAPSKKFWLIADPQFIFDHENDRNWTQLEFEAGSMMFGPTSNYIRPSIGIGDDKTYDWSIEFGFKVIWR